MIPSQRQAGDVELRRIPGHAFDVVKVLRSGRVVTVVERRTEPYVCPRTREALERVAAQKRKEAEGA